MKKIFESQLTYLVMLIMMLIIFYILSIGPRKRLMKNHIVVCCRVLEMRAGKGVNVVFEFYVDLKRYECNQSSSKIIYDNYKKGMYNFWIVAEKSNPKNNVFLEEEEDFKKYGITEADTLSIRCN